MIKNDFYVYVYLDPRKPGIFIYDDYVFEYEPFYIGKGKNKRLLRHLKDNVNSYKKNKISKIISCGLEPIIKKVKENLNEKLAFSLEIDLISLIGRVDNGGVLVNMSDGGEGQSGFKHSQETKDKISDSLKTSEKHKSIMNSIEYRKKLSDALMGHKGSIFNHSEDVKRHLSDIQVGDKNTFFGKTHSENQKKKWSKERIGKSNGNTVKYIISTPDEKELSFTGKNELKDYFLKLNSDQNLSGPSRISYYNIIVKGESKNYKLLRKIKINKI